MKKVLVFLSALTLALAFLPVCAQAQYLAWHYDRLIENNASRTAMAPQIAMSGLAAVAVWQQLDGSNYRMYANYSINAGKTWHNARLIENNAGSDAYYPHMAMSGKNVVAVWIQYYNGHNRVFANSSKDGGATWRTDQMIEDDAGPNAEYPGPKVSISGPNAVVVWQQSDGTHVRIYANYSTDGGATWHSRQTIDAATSYDSLQPWVAVSGLNAVAAFLRSDGSNDRMRYNYSTNGGASWHTDQLLENNAGYNAFYPVQVAMSGANAVAVWHQYAASIGSCIYANHSSDGGATWDGDQIIKPLSLSAASYPQVAMSGTRVVSIWVHQETGGLNYINSNYSIDGGTTWNTPHRLEANSTYAPGYAHVALSGSNAVAVWRQSDGSGNRIFTSYSTNGGASWPELRTLDGIAATVGSAGVPKVAISGTKAAAVWAANDGVSDRVVSNYASFYASHKYFLRPPKLSSPANGVTGLPTTVTLSWQDTNDPSGPQELKYKIRIKPAGGAYTFINVPANSVIYAKSGLAHNKTYSWNVQAVGNGTTVLTSPWANGGVDWKFTTAL